MTNKMTIKLYLYCKNYPHEEERERLWTKLINIYLLGTRSSTSPWSGEISLPLIRGQFGMPKTFTNSSDKV